MARAVAETWVLLVTLPVAGAVVEIGPADGLQAAGNANDGFDMGRLLEWAR